MEEVLSRLGMSLQSRVLRSLAACLDVSRLSLSDIFFSRVTCQMAFRSRGGATAFRSNWAALALPFWFHDEIAILFARWHCHFVCMMALPFCYGVSPVKLKVVGGDLAAYLLIRKKRGICIDSSPDVAAAAWWRRRRPRKRRRRRWRRRRGRRFNMR